MPIKPIRRPVVSSTTGRPTDDRCAGRPTDSPHHRSPAAAAGDRRAAEPSRRRTEGRSAGPHDRRPAERAPQQRARHERALPGADRSRPVLAADRPTGLYLSCAAGVESLLAAEAHRILGPALTVTESRGGIEIQPGQIGRAHV